MDFQDLVNLARLKLGDVPLQPAPLPPVYLRDPAPSAAAASTDSTGEPACPGINDNLDDVDDVDDEDDEDDGEEGETEHKSSGPLEKRRRESAAFELWLDKQQRAITASSSTLNNSPDASSEVSSHGQGSQKIISSPREYQLDLFERAKHSNTIVVLDTGSGKTLIAALLLRHVLEQELEHRARGEPHRMAFFLVEKVALCFQQHDVLSSNLAFPIGRVFGDARGENTHTKQFWERQLAENMAVVCTAQILLGVLDCGFVKMDSISLLVFDEAHHAKKNHPYARIIRSHYLRQEPQKRPRVLGMTASPVDSRVKDVRLAASDLEAMLCSTIATVSDDVLRRSHTQRQQSENRVVYGRLRDPQESRTNLWGEIAGLVGDNEQFRNHLHLSQQAASTLGGWCADRYWELLMTDAEAVRLGAKIGRDFAEFDALKGDEAVNAVERVIDMVRKHPFQAVSRSSPCLSSKAELLHGLLEDAFHKGAKRCIVFAQARSTAFLLAYLFQQREMLIPGLTAAYMTGWSASNTAGMSYREQVLALQKFRRGETNCLFATAVAEEGIDIPDCDVVIRFDLFASAIQYIQSKGRARQRSSVYISMMEEGNADHRRRLDQAARDANALRRFCSALPEDRRVQDYTLDAAATMAPGDTMAQGETPQRTYLIPETGARLTLPGSLEVLAMFASSLPGQDNRVEYLVTSAARKNFVARVIFPEGSPIKTAEGQPERSKQLARCSAAFEACVELIKKGYVDTHLQPKFATKLPSMRNARLALRSELKSESEMRLKPDFWSRCLRTASPMVLYPTLLRLDSPEALGRDSRPLILLTRIPLPEVPAIPLFFGNDRSSLLRPHPSRLSVEATPKRLALLAAFTLRVFADVFSKEYAADPDQISYFIVPADPGSDIDWDMIEGLKLEGKISWENVPEAFFINRLAIDPWDGSRKFILHGINKDLKPSDPTPNGVPARKRSNKQIEETIKEYSNSLGKRSRNRGQWRDDQPVLDAELLSTRRNFLDEFSIDPSPRGRCYVIPEPLRLSPLTADVVAMALVLPVIMYRIDNALITLEACDALGLSIRPDLALEAMTRDSVNSSELGAETQPVKFQPGMGKNYERLEFLGDTVLKMATTIAVFTLMPTGDECECHVERMLMLCNQNLFSHAVSQDRRLHESVRSKAFDRRAWYPQMMKLTKGKACKTRETHWLSHKSIADVCEALIGAAYMSHRPTSDDDFSRCGGEVLDAAVKAVTVMVRSEKHTMLSFRDYWAAFTVPAWHNRPATAVQQLAVAQVADAVGYRFQSAPLLRSAFRHPSYTFDTTVPDYQRLEFLGDALLDMAAVDFLFRRFPDADPQWLTEHKMAMVSNHFQGFLCVRLGLHRHMLLATAALLGDVNEYVAQLRHAECAARLEGGTPLAPLSWWTWLGAREGEAIRGGGAVAPSPPPSPPKALADVLEALVGAMFVDSMYDYGVVQRFFTRHVQPHFEDVRFAHYIPGPDTDTTSISISVRVPENPYEAALAQRLRGKLGCTQWCLHVASVPPATDAGVAVLSTSLALCALTVHGKVLVHETAKSGSAAKAAVCKVAVKRLDGLAPGVFQAETGCQCHAREGSIC